MFCFSTLVVGTYFIIMLIITLILYLMDELRGSVKLDILLRF